MSPSHIEAGIYKTPYGEGSSLGVTLERGRNGLTYTLVIFHDPYMTRYVDVRDIHYLRKFDDVEKAFYTEYVWRGGQWK